MPGGHLRRFTACISSLGGSVSLIHESRSRGWVWAGPAATLCPPGFEGAAAARGPGWVSAAAGACWQQACGEEEARRRIPWDGLQFSVPSSALSCRPHVPRPPQWLRPSGAGSAQAARSCGMGMTCCRLAGHNDLQNASSQPGEDKRDVKAWGQVLPPAPRSPPARPTLSAAGRSRAQTDRQTNGGVPPAGCLLLVTAAAFRAHL